MRKDDYQNLNYYLNGCFKKLEKNDQFLIDNIEFLIYLSHEYIKVANNYEIDNNQTINNLTFGDVYLLAREVIESIDESYLKYYDNLIESGKLDFSYENEYANSYFEFSGTKDIRNINISRKFNYSDVSVLVHEFMHYMNHLDKYLPINTYLLTETISIYFEEYAKLYLVNKGISKDELFLNERICFTSEASSNFNYHCMIIYAYSKFGNIDENTYELIQQYFFPISKKEFNEQCNKLLKEFKKEEKEYRNTIFDKDFKEDNLFNKLVTILNRRYRYILGTVLAYYALEHSSKEKMTYLCNHINDYNYQMMSIKEVLKTIDIDINEIDVDVIERKIIENGVNKISL